MNTIKILMHSCFFGSIVIISPAHAFPICSNTLAKSSTDEFSLFGVQVEEKWPNGSVLMFSTDFDGTNYSNDRFPYVCITSDSELECHTKVIQRIQDRASLWSKYGNISFKYTPNWTNADIRIRFQKKDDPSTDSFKESGAWSYVGRKGNKYSTNNFPKLQTMNLDATWWDDSWIDAVITHEFGHAIGFLHEHERSGLTGYVIDKDKANAYYNTFGWTPAEVQNNVLDKIDTTSAAYFVTDYDDKSIMRYSVPLGIISDNTKGDCPSRNNPYYCVSPNYDLSELDKSGVAIFYPFVFKPPNQSYNLTPIYYYLNL